MIDFGGYYLVPVEQIEYIDASSSEDGTGWHNLNAHLLSGRVLTIKYRSKTARDEGWRKLYTEIEAERRRSSDEIIARLSLIRDGVERVDKRQFRIWKQLKTLLNVEPEEKI